MDKKDGLIPENLSELQANFAGHLVKFEEIRGFL
jgi:hypothetical protein